MTRKQEFEFLLPKNLLTLLNCSSSEIDVWEEKELIHKNNSSETAITVDTVDFSNSVSFCDEVIMAGTLHHSEYSQEERQNYWYRKEEVFRMKQMDKPTIALMRAGALEQDTDRHCIRGLENRLYSRAIERRRTRKIAQAAVLEEQCIQWREGYSSSDDIAACYKEATTQCGVRARALAVEDELDAFGPMP
eukprot:CAMPEP_0194211616 /NCGR_PEP_ID=MMETSP0156-20130528/10701_1 /TAXON_ID=33649 /ORGANISM="Thalassionema nitzschioides, Strain L26-B" /LENGTH=190 /DNA_ID=CAMNT_0038939225 /DNA_START=4 /DNA_END=573 /DNA_ORIENTATION=-